MEVLRRQNIEKQDVSIFLRDLSEDVKTNLKHMIEDMVRVEDEIKKTENIKKGRNKTVIKKKDIIIQRQNEIRRIRDIEGDKNRITYFLKTMDKSNPFESISKLKTIEGRDCFKYEILKMFWNEDKKSI